VTCSVLGCQCSIPVFLPLQVHEEEDALNVWMYDAVENNGKYTRWQALGQLTTALALLAGLYGLSVLYDAPSRNPAVSRATVQQGRGTLQHGAGHLAFTGATAPPVCRHRKSTPLKTSTWSVVVTRAKHPVRQSVGRRSRARTAASPPEEPTTDSTHTTISRHVV